MATLYRIWIEHQESGTNEFFEESYLTSPLNAYHYLEHLYENNYSSEDITYFIEWIQPELDKDRVTMVQIVNVRDRTGCELKEAEEALYLRNGCCSLAVELIKNKDFTDFMSEDEAFPQWAKFKKWLVDFKAGKIPQNPYQKKQKEASWEDL